MRLRGGRSWLVSCWPQLHSCCSPRSTPCCRRNRCQCEAGGGRQGAARFPCRARDNQGHEGKRSRARELTRQTITPPALRDRPKQEESHDKSDEDCNEWIRRNGGVWHVGERSRDQSPELERVEICA